MIHRHHAATRLGVLAALLALAGCTATDSTPGSRPAPARALGHPGLRALDQDSADTPLVGAGPASTGPTASPTTGGSPTPASHLAGTTGPLQSATGQPSAGPTALTPVNPPAATPTSVYGYAFQVAGGGTGDIGPASGKLVHYKVAVQTGLTETPDETALIVDRILDDQVHGWLRGGQWRFQRVSGSATADFTVELATAATTDAICAKYGIDTAGVVSCRGGPNVVINLTRWEQGTNGTTAGAVAYPVDQYRVLVIGHEVGHALGHHHVGCPGPGLPAPVMMTQYFGVNGCVPNIYPYATDGTYLTGPPV